METYTYSFFYIQTKIVPHRIWWKRLFGGKEKIKIQKYHKVSFECPKEIAEDGTGWFQNVLKNFSNSFGYNHTIQLETGTISTNYIKTDGVTNQIRTKQ